MRTLIEILASLAILANGVIYGTDAFGAIVMRPAIAAVDDRTLTQLLGRCAADPRPRRALRRARRGLTLRSSRRRIVRCANRKEQNGQPTSSTHVAPGS